MPKSIRCDCPGERQASRKRLGNLWAGCAGRRSANAPTVPNSPRRSKPAASAPTRSAFRLRSCIPLTVLRLISLPHAARSTALFARGTSRRRRCNSARHFSLRSTQRRRSVASPSRTARSKRGRFKSQSKSKPPYPRLDQVPAVYPVAPVVPYPLLRVGYANPALDSKALDHGLVRAKVVRNHRLCPVTAYETTEPLYESVRIALDQRFQPQNLARFSVRDYADDRFLALHANYSLISAHHCHASARSCAIWRRRRRGRSRGRQTRGCGDGGTI